MEKNIESLLKKKWADWHKRGEFTESNLRLIDNSVGQKGYFVGFPRGITNIMSVSPFDDIEQSKLIDNLRFSNNYFHLKFFNGHNNNSARRIREIASQPAAFSDLGFRAEYQGLLYTVLHPILVASSKYDTRIIKDNISSGGSIVGIIKLLRDKSKLKGRIIRIDVGTATPQGLEILRKYAESNHIKMEINAGYLVYGIPRGENGVPAVGDVQDFSEILPDAYNQEYQWNELRAKEENGVQFNHKRPTIVFLGDGRLMKAFYKCANPKDNKYNEIIINTANTWSSDQSNNGVLIGNLPEDILK